MIHQFPVEVSIEGEGLDPDGSCSILGSCLKEIDAMLSRITVTEYRALGKEREASGCCHNSPQSSSPSAGSTFPLEGPPHDHLLDRGTYNKLRKS